MNKKILFPLTLIPLVSTSLQAQKSVQTQRVDKRPNIILFMVDDMGWQDTSLPFWMVFMYIIYKIELIVRRAK